MPMMLTLQTFQESFSLLSNSVRGAVFWVTLFNAAVFNEPIYSKFCSIVSSDGRPDFGYEDRIR